MRTQIKLVATFLFCTSMVFAESKGTPHIYTICQRKLCLISEPSDLVSFRNMIPWSRDISGYFEPDKPTLLKYYDALRDDLYKNIDLTKCNNREYQHDDIVFSFYEYYLQFVPFCKGAKKMVYINAYRRGYDKIDSSDESPASKIVTVFDGGSYFWSIIYDIEEDKFINLSINGVG